MLVIDGVKYQEWIPQKEEDEFQPIVKEHFPEIFSTRIIDIEGNILKSESGIGAKPDWFVISLCDTPQWYIVEAELSSHRLYDHIVNQIGRFINGIDNTIIQKKIVDAIYHKITDNKVRKAEVEEAIGSGEIYKFLSDLISKPPILTIIIERKTAELEEAINLLRYSPIKIVEFQTFVREGAGLAVHGHLFAPVNETIKETKIQIVEEVIKPKVTASDFTHKGNGIFALKSNPSISVDVKRKQRLVTQQLADQGLTNRPINNLYYSLRKKAGLLNSLTED